MDKILDMLKSLPKEILTMIVYALMQEGKITFHELAEMHARHLEELRKGQSEHYMKLFGMMTHIYHDKKKNRDKNIKDVMHYLLDCGELNTTHEAIDKG